LIILLPPNEGGNNGSWQGCGSDWFIGRSTAQALALRARMILMAAAGATNTAIADRLGIGSQHTVGVGASVLRASGSTVSSTSHVRRPMSERTSQDFAFVPGCLASVDAEPVSQATNTRQVSGTSRRCVTGLRADLKRERRDRASSVGGTMRSRAWPS